MTVSDYEFINPRFAKCKMFAQCDRILQPPEATLYPLGILDYTFGACVYLFIQLPKEKAPFPFAYLIEAKDTPPTHSHMQTALHLHPDKVPE